MPSNVLFPGRKSEAESFLAVDINASTNNAAWHQSQVGHAASENTVDRATASDWTSKRLAFTNHNVCSVSAWRLDQSEGDWLNCHDERGVLTDNFLQHRNSAIQDTNWVWLLDIDAAGACSLLSGGEINGSVRVVSEQFDANLRTLAIILHDRHAVGRRQFRDVYRVFLHCFAVVNTNAAGNRLSSGSGAVVEGEVRNWEANKF